MYFWNADSVNYLGILIDKCLNCKTHMDFSKIVGMIAKIRHYVPLSVTIKLYQSLILPHLTYGISGWGQASQSNLEKLLRLQKRVLRLMTFSKKSENAIPFL